MTAIGNYERSYAVVCNILFVLYILVIIVLVKTENIHSKTHFSFCSLQQAYPIVSNPFCGILFSICHDGQCFDLSTWKTTSWWHSFSDWHTVILYRIGMQLYCIQLSRAMNILMGLNRMSAMKRPLEHESTWHQNMVKKCIIGALVAAFVINAQYWIIWGIEGVAYVPAFNGTSLVVLMDNPDPINYKIWMLITSLQAMTMVPIFLVIYGMAFWHFHKHSKKMNKVASANTVPNVDKKKQRKKYKIEFKLLLMSFILSFSQMAYGINIGLALASFETFVKSDPYFYVVRFATIFQIDSLFNPLMIIIMSSKVRRCFIKFVKCSY